MKHCAEFEPLLTQYVDGEIPSTECAAVEGHIAACPPCREVVEAERSARAWLRANRDRLTSAAPEMLRTRCAAHIRGPRRATAARRWVPLSLAASVLLATAAVFFYGSFGSMPALAAQLTFDHWKCFRLPPSRATTAADVERELAKALGWSVRVPGSAPGNEIELVGARRCLSADGRIAHVLYLCRGRPVSLYVVPDGRDAHEPRLLEIIGHKALIWTKDSRTFVVLGRESREELERLATYVRNASREGAP